jgi:aromatic-L-amino-acid decarboxylase
LQGAVDRPFERLVERLCRTTIDTAQGSYFGPPQDGSVPEGRLGALMAAVLNPQLAVAVHAPFARALERAALQRLGARLTGEGDELHPFGAFGDGLFTQGAAESNHLALVCALAALGGGDGTAYRERGLRAFPTPPIVYASNQAHASVERSARFVGLGKQCMVHVGVNACGELFVDALQERLAQAQARGAAPPIVVATVGTTATGAMDDVTALAELTRSFGGWLHVDAAFGALLGFAQAELGRACGWHLADSFAFDPHKTLGVPVGTGVLFVRDRAALVRAASVGTATPASRYMPSSDEQDDYQRGFAWSRRAIGLPVATLLALRGMPRIEADAWKKVRLGDRIHGGIAALGYPTLDRSVREGLALPIVCFSPVEAASVPSLDAERRGAEEDGDRVARRRRMRVWRGLRDALRRDALGSITPVMFQGTRYLRATVGSHRTCEADVERLLVSLVRARDDARGTCAVHVDPSSTLDTEP